MANGKRTIVEIMTYVDRNSLTPARERLHRVIETFVRDYAEGIKRCFDVTYYETTVIDTDEPDIARVMSEQIKAAVDGARALVLTPEWKSYEANVGAYG